ncbi:outer membrane receptor for ferrienterochelin and colicin [Idiomarina sp. A28L]|uniref:TonB-dependent receptor n=1 Tax=Idiomarina sp. A28L TaxID=1036674 RepID=UPI0002138CA3|nr:TonB-dependent receptor [Idiomarina sp. A28L]EGN75446.1 outer membrane receptor for ferrienterochelin and colicin [Idiomarina sp. A28L]
MHKLSLLAIAVGVGLSPAPQALAQDSEAEAERIERISVTGSRVLRAEAESAAPVQVFTAEDIEASGLTSMELVLQKMSASAGFGGNQTSAYWVGGGWGTTQVNLRGLGANRTLVLLNGRRVVNGGTGANSSVDLNTLPLTMVERIEVLKDGASAIYGADAVAGVVNVITRKSFDGVMVEGRVAGTDKSDGEERSVNLMFGTSSDRGRLVSTISFRDTDEVNMGDRAACALAETSPGELGCFGSASTPGGRAVITSGPETGRMINFNQTAGGDPKGFETYSAGAHNVDFFNMLNAVNPVTTISFSTFGDYRVGDETYVFTEVLYNNRRSSQIATPGTLRNINYSADHPDNPVGEDIRIVQRRLEEAGPRGFEQDVNTFRVVAGMNGLIDYNWAWEVAYNFGRTTGNDAGTNIANLERMNRAIDPDTCGSNGVPCADLIGLGNVSQEALDYMLFRINDYGGNQQQSLTANVAGDLFEIGDRVIPVAFGLEHRKERGWREPDSSVVAGIMNTNRKEPLSGHYSVTELYAETSVPLISDQKFADSVFLDLAYRYSDYDTFGSDGNYKLGLHWNVNENVKFRATQSTAFRVPNIPELFGGIGEGNLTTSDPCSGWDQPGANPTVAANCQADGVPAGYAQFGSTVLTRTGGNPNLQPEDADTFTAGVVWDVGYVEGLQITVDYFDIQIENAIRGVGGSTKLNACYNSENLSHPFCSSDTFTRDPLTGSLDFLSSQPANVATEKVSGMDVSAFYLTSMFGLNAKFNINLTYLDEYTIEPFPGASAIEYAGKITGGSGSFTRIRSDASATFSGEQWQFHYGVRMIGAANDINASPGDLGSKVSNTFYHNVQGAWFIDDNWTLSAGVNNLLDKKAPFIRSWTDANTDTMTYDLMGRQLYVKLRYQF